MKRSLPLAMFLIGLVLVLGLVASIPAWAQTPPPSLLPGTPAPNFYTAGDSSTGGDLFRWNGSGPFAEVGPFGAGASVTCDSMSTGPEALYAHCYVTGLVLPDMYTIDRTTGESTRLGRLIGAGVLSGIAWSDGTLYAYETGTSSGLVSINLDDLTTTNILAGPIDNFNPGPLIVRGGEIYVMTQPVTPSTLVYVYLANIQNQTWDQVATFARPAGFAVADTANDGLRNYLMFSDGPQVAGEIYQIDAAFGLGPKILDTPAGGPTLIHRGLASIPIGVSDISPDSATFHWAAGSLATSYFLEHREVGTSTSIFHLTSNQTLTASGLRANTEYEVRVRSHNSAGASPFTAYANFRTTMGPQLEATPLVTYTAGPDYLDLQWSGVRFADGYRIEYRVFGSADPFLLYLSLSPSARLPNLASSTTYEVQIVTLRTGSPESPPSTPIIARTLAAVPDVPTLLAVSSITQVSAVAGWTASPDAHSYRVEFRRIGEALWRQGETDVTSLLLSPLEPFNLHEVRVAALSVDREASAYSRPVEFRTLSNQAGQPSSLRAINILDTTATLTWGAGQPADSYSVALKATTDPTYKILGTTPNLYYELTSLVSGTEYEGRVIASATGIPQASAPIYVTFTAGPSRPDTGGITGVLAAPPAPNVRAVADQQALVSWASVSQAADYLVLLRLADESTYSEVGTTVNLRFELNALTKGTIYYVAIRARNPTAASQPSPPTQFQTTLDGRVLPTPTPASPFSGMPGFDDPDGHFFHGSMLWTFLGLVSGALIFAVSRNPAIALAVSCAVFGIAIPITDYSVLMISMLVGSALVGGLGLLLARR